jgi:hypothetical protein
MKITQQQPARSPRRLPRAGQQEPAKESVHLAGQEVPVVGASLGTKLALGLGALGGAALLTEVMVQVGSQASLGAMVGAAGMSLGAAVTGYLVADLGSGFFHHAMDNYAKPTTPVVGEIAALSRSHHYFANSPEQNTVAGEMDPIAKLVGPAAAALAVLNPHYLLAAGSLAGLAGTLVAQTSHRLTHQRQTVLSQKLARFGLIQKQADHHAHHRAPWTSNYCFVNGACNRLLDSSNFWRRYERAIFKISGVEPKGWKHPAVRDFALGKIDKTQFEQRFQAEIPQFKQAIRFEEEREISRTHLHTRFLGRS